jgi:hypothetical protein
MDQRCVRDACDAKPTYRLFGTQCFGVGLLALGDRGVRLVALALVGVGLLLLVLGTCQFTLVAAWPPFERIKASANGVQGVEEIVMALTSHCELRAGGWDTAEQLVRAQSVDGFKR